jgi:hypothetical protein
MIRTIIANILIFITIYEHIITTNSLFVKGVIMAKKPKKSPPSREKYDEAKPVVSFRVSRELFDRLEAVKEAEGKSNADVLSVGVGLLKVKIGKEKEIRDHAYEEGWEKGVEEACNIFLVAYLCSVCGKEIEVTTDDEKRAIKTYMHQYRWGHADCVNRR